MSWIQKGGDIDGEFGNDLSGFSVSLNADGNIMAIGAPFNNNSSGYVRVYEFNEDIMDWVQKGDDINGEAVDDESGWSVSLSSEGNIVAIGAPFNNGNGINSRGHVRVYEFNENNGWVQKGGDIDGEEVNDLNGFSVSLSANGNIVAIGSPLNDGNGINSGHVRVYEFNENEWVQKGGDIDGEFARDRSGFSVSLSADGNIVAIGAPFNNNSRGHVRVYEFNEDINDWLQKGGDIDSEATGDQNGFSVSLSANGNIVAIGSPLNDGNGIDSGHVRVYEFNENNGWVQKGGDIDGEIVNDESGFSVSLSADGNIVAVAIEAPFNNDNRGHVKVYEFNENNEWLQKGDDIDGEAVNDQNSFSVSLSANGNIVAIGVPFNDSNGNNSGKVRVFEFEENVQNLNFLKLVNFNLSAETALVIYKNNFNEFELNSFISKINLS